MFNDLRWDVIVDHDYLNFLSTSVWLSKQNLVNASLCEIIQLKQLTVL